MTEKKAKILEFENAKKSYDQLTVLKNLNLNVYQGEITCLLGPSGSGKTTVFRTAAGMEELDEGEIIKKDSLRLAYVFQEPRLLPWKTAEENLIFVQKNYNLEKESKLRELLFNLSGLSNFKNSYPHELSGGMKQRLELIRAFAVKADLVFLDEPLKSLDMKTKYNLRKMITLIQKESGISLFFITHDPEEALLLADRIYILAGEGSGIKKEMLIKKDRSQRKISDPELYQKLEEIMAIFTDLVAEFEVDQKDLKEL
ncbi:ABC transporter ATP-binding protein [Halanaerobium sp. Z-7514]|uniref:ABC transporter ATP-binding protein n=1 Tax=Halanaerobium polyolivorans TaxID=2886943 RepID=A0AAW4WTS7_9FIRM|nr:ABC transporter ATP-binding protein [Halanaerobium polyolivorans]MCC3144492.1 ABC transporter ATP-binding protein [Halanaerobium polyolivorans]